jgi:hypothetical protein
MAATDFRDEASAILGLRLFSIEINAPGPGWRLTIPKPLAAIMQVRPKESTVAMLLSGGHIEIWTLDLIRASVRVPLSELV